MNKLQYYRKQQKLTLEQTALLLGYKNKSSYNEIEKGRCQPKASVILKMSILFKVSTDEIIKALIELEYLKYKLYEVKKISKKKKSKHYTLHYKLNIYRYLKKVLI